MLERVFLVALILFFVWLICRMISEFFKLPDGGPVLSSDREGESEPVEGERYEGDNEGDRRHIIRG